MSCKITKHCVKLQELVYAHAWKCVCVRSRWSANSHRQKILSDLRLPPRKSWWFVLGREEGKWPFIVWVRRKAISHRYFMQLLRCLQMFFLLRIACISSSCRWKLVNECDSRWTMRVDNEGDSEGDPGPIITMSDPATIHLVLGQVPGLLNIHLT